MLVLCKVIDENTKEIVAGLEDQRELLESRGYTDQEIETCWNGKAYLKGYAPSKPASELIKDYKQELVTIDEKSLRATRAIALNKGTDKDVETLTKLEADAEELRAKIKELENAEAQ